MWQYNELYHHGIQGQKWGVRRYQNPDGTLTEEGKRRYGTYGKKHVSIKAYRKDLEDTQERLWQQSPKAVAAMRKERAYYDLDNHLQELQLGNELRYGNPDTKETKRIDKRLYQMADEYNQLLREAKEEVTKQATERMIEKYGSERVKKLESKGKVLDKVNEVRKVMAEAAEDYYRIQNLPSSSTVYVNHR